MIIRYLSVVAYLLLVCLIGHAQSGSTVLSISHQPTNNTHKEYNPLYGELYKLPSAFQWTPDEKKEEGRKMEVKLKRAAAAVLLIENLNLAFGESLEVVDGQGRSYWFDSRQVSEKGILNTGILPGQSIELIWHFRDSPTSVTGLTISRIVLFDDLDYQTLSLSDPAKDFGEADNCNVNINCAQGSNIQEEKRGVARIMIVVEEGMGWCSGSLINNTSEDYGSYFLTAYHCQDGFTPLFDFWRFDFNYEDESCAGGLDEPLADAVTGCSFLVGRQSSDYMLLEISSTIPYSYRPYWNGWNRSDQSSGPLIMTHHPVGDIKKVTRYDDVLRIRSFPRNINWTNNITTPADHHWEAPHTSGMFEVGSSGAPALDAQGRIVGQLHGGAIGCTDGVSYFGKLSRSWIDIQGDAQGLHRYLAQGEPDRMDLGGLRAPDSYCSDALLFNQSEGFISDGSQGDIYLPGSYCAYRIQLPDEQRQVRLELNQIDLGSGDTIFIHDGKDASANVLDVWTGSSPIGTSVLASSNELFIAFEADNTSERQGFELRYSSEDVGIDVQVSMELKNSEKAIVYLYNSQFMMIDSAEYNAAESASFETLFSIDVNSGIYYLEAKVYQGDLREGVSTLDLLRMETVFKGDQPWKDIYEWMAADVDNNYVVNLADLISISRFVRRLENAWMNQPYISLYNPEELQNCEDEDWSTCLQYNPVKYVEINTENAMPTGALRTRFERFQKGDLNRSAGF